EFNEACRVHLAHLSQVDCQFDSRPKPFQNNNLQCDACLLSAHLAHFAHTQARKKTTRKAPNCSPQSVLYLCMTTSTNNSGRATFQQSTRELARRAMSVQPVSQLTPRPVSWLWPGRLALGKLAMLDGDPDLGKSLVTLDLCTRLSRGLPFP